jgi:regulator of sirC expression with transglutaminase-like and TPR domain
MDATRRFAELIGGPEHDVALDEGALLIAAHAYPDLDVDGELARLDDLAAPCPERDVDGLVRWLFGELGYTGNVQAYHDPRNSYLNDVVERRTGIPISLAVLAMVVGERIGVGLDGVGMPGHFLLRDREDPDGFVDPFAGGARLAPADCVKAFHALHGADTPFDPRYLDPVGPVAVLGRMLANLRGIFSASGDRRSLQWVLRLRLEIPGVPPEERAELAALLAAGGRFGDAAHELDTLAGQLGGELGDEYRRSAERFRARLN